MGTDFPMTQTNSNIIVVLGSKKIKNSEKGRGIRRRWRASPAPAGRIRGRGAVVAVPERRGLRREPADPTTT